MTSVTFPFFVGKPDPDTKKITFKDAEFRFTTKTSRQLEISAGCGIEWLIARGQSVHTLILLVCYGLMWNKNLKMNEDKAIDLIDAFVDAGGDTSELTKACMKAMNSSGVYGLPEQKDDEKKPTETKDGEDNSAAPLPSENG
jgi:hypothetical protein